jgi:hypothetical protein
MKRSTKRGKKGSETESARSLESIVIDILRGNCDFRYCEPLRLGEIYTIIAMKGVKTTLESLRKCLERLEIKGVVKRYGRGSYVYVKHLTLDMFARPEILPLDNIVISHMAGFELLKLVEKGELRLQRARDIEVTDLVIGGAVADDSSRPLGTYAHWSSGLFVRVSARIRIGGIVAYNVFIKEGAPVLDVKIEDMDLIPEHLTHGDSVEFLIERLRRPYLDSVRAIRGLSGEVAREIAEKLSHYDLEEFNQDLIELAIAKAKYKATWSDLAVVLIDGSILPGHLDPKIHPESKDLEDWPSDLRKLILGRKERILRRFLHIYDSVYTSRNVVLIGVAKRSNDRTLQYKANVYYGVPDQILLSNVMREGEIIGPFVKHRVEEELVNELKKFSIKYAETIRVDSYYVMVKEKALPLQIDVVFPKHVDELNGRDVRNTILWLIAHPYLSEISRKHTWYNEQGEIIPTLKPIEIVDREVSKKSEEIARLIEKDLAKSLYNVLRQLEELALKGADISLYVFNSHVRGLRRVM